MPDQLQLRGGTTAQHASFTGASKEVTVDTTKKTVVVHDGSTAGGNPVMREDGSNAALALGSAASPSLKFTGDTNTGIYSPGADQVAISTNGTGRLFVRSGGNVEINPSATEANDRKLFIRGNGNFDGAVLLKSSSTPDGTTRGFLVQSFGASSDAYLWQQENSPLILGTNSTERLRITSAGLVGIGTSSVSFDLQVDKDVNSLVTAYIRSYNAGASAGGRVSAASNVGSLTMSAYSSTHSVWPSTCIISSESSFTGGLVVNAGGANPLRFWTNATERFRCDSSGRLLVGTTTGTAQLTVQGARAEVRNTNGASIGNSITTSVSTTATTIIDDAGFQGRLWVINGADASNRFCDLVMASTSVAPVVVQSFSALNTPAARTYTRSGSAVQLAMASGTYDVRCIGFGA